MKKFKTYGKTKSKEDIRSTDWDDIVNSEPKNKQEIKNVKKKYNLKSKYSENLRDNTQIHTPNKDNAIHSPIVKSKEKKENSNDKQEINTENDVNTPKPKHQDKSCVIVSSDDEINKEEDLNVLFENLNVNAVSTPKPTVTTLDLDCSFKCRRSISLTSSNKKKSRKKLSSLKSEYNSSYNSIQDCSLCSNNNSFFKDSLTSFNGPISSEKKILDLCEQKELLHMNEYVEKYSEIFLKKLGEGSYGEVFEKESHEDKSLAVKIVPVGCDTLVNGYPQMTLDAIIPEMAISKKLLDLTLSKEDANYAEGFIQLQKLLFCKGSYPTVLNELWVEWDAKKASENDNPDIFQEDQTFVIFETNNGGEDLETFKLKTVKEAISILKQIIASLAAAECMYQFEHRDLHHGNILIKKTSRNKPLNFIIDNEVHKVESHGLEVCIIDFTMARLQADGGVIYTDISTEETFFTGEGDIQFDVYRDMRKHNKNEWESYNPYTNVLWMKYIAEKLLVKRKNATLPKFINNVLNYKSCTDIVSKDNMFAVK